MQTTSSGLMSLFTPPAVASTLESPAIDGALPQGFSSLLSTLLLPPAASPTPSPLPLPLSPLPTKLQDLPLLDANLAAASAEPQTTFMAPTAPALETQLNTLFAQIAYAQRQGEQPLVAVDAEADAETDLDATTDSAAELSAEALAALALPPPPTTAPAPPPVPSNAASAEAAVPAATQAVNYFAKQTARPAPAAVDNATLVMGGDDPATEPSAPVRTAWLNQVQPETPAPVTTLTPNVAVELAPTPVPVVVATALNAAHVPTPTVEISRAVEVATAPPAAPANAKLELGADQRYWSGALGSRIVTMVADDVQEARIHLDPPELGSLEIKLHIQQQQAVIQVQAQHGHVRDVLEANAQRLRDALAEHGIELTGFDVSSRNQNQEQAQAQQQGQSGNGDYAVETADGWLGADDPQLTTMTPAQTLSLLDTFA